jgi:hypothetical protein
MIRQIALVVALLPSVPLSSLPRAAPAQPTRCVSTEYSKEILAEHVLPIFRRGENAEIRRSIGIRKVGRFTRAAIVTDAKTCERLVEATHAAFRALYGEQTSMDARELHVFRVGDYYAVLPQWDAETQARMEVVVTGRSDLLIFRRETLEYLGFVLV